MSRKAALAARRQLLLARSQLHRLEMRHNAMVLRQSVMDARGALATMAAPPLGGLAIAGALLLAIGPRRFAHAASLVTAFAAVFSGIRRFLR